MKDYEFGNYCFETLPKATGTSVSEKLASVDSVDICEINITYDNPKNSQFSIQLPLSNEKVACLQEKDAKIHQLWGKVKNGLYADFYFIKNDILYRSIVDNGHKFNAAVISEDLTGTVLHLGHNQSGPQWLPENLCCNQTCLLLERNEETCTGSLQKLCHLC